MLTLVHGVYSVSISSPIATVRLRRTDILNESYSIIKQFLLLESTTEQNASTSDYNFIAKRARIPIQLSQFKRTRACDST